MDASREEVPGLPRSVVGSLLVFGLIAVALFAGGRNDYPNLHTILDAGMFLLSAVLAFLLWDIGKQAKSELPRMLSVSFGVTSLLELVHVMVVVEWTGPLAPIARAQDLLRPATWPPITHVLPVGIGCSLLLAQSRRRWAPWLAGALLLASAALFVLFSTLPRHTDPAWLGITRPALITPPFLWAFVAWRCRRDASSGRIVPMLGTMAPVLIVANAIMLFSRAPHDTQAIVAHLGRACGYFIVLQALNQMASRDIGERSAAERKFRGLLESAPDAIVIVNRQGKIVLINSQTESLFGYAREELLGQALETIVPERFRGKHPKHRDGFFADPRARPMGANLELFGLRRDGTEFPVEISLSPLETEEGVLAMSAIRDITSRKQAEAQFRGLLESAPDAMVLVDRLGSIVLVNSRTETLFGYQRAELLGHKIEMLVPDRFRGGHPQHREAFFAGPKPRPMGAGLELFGMRKDGTEFPVEISLSPIESQGGLLAMSAIRDITDRKIAEAQALHAREMYLKELHHRVKNNLQVVSSLLFLQSSHTADPSTLEILKESQNRVRSIALIHEKLYRSAAFSRIDFGEYIRDLVGDLSRTYGVGASEVTIRIEVENVSMAIDTAIPCGLIINELVSNVFKHAFPAGKRGTLSITMSRSSDAMFLLSIGDDGIGLPDGFDSTKSASLGLKLVSDLTRQLDGKMEIDAGPGAHFRIAFKEVSYKEREGAA